MRIALLGWDLERDAIAAIRRLGVEVVTFTRWFADEPERVSHSGWQEVRCPHSLGGGPIEESQAFGVAVVRTASTTGLGFDFDVVHALDRRSRPAAGELAVRGGAVLTALDQAAEEDVPDLGFGSRENPDAWICDHAWSAERLRERLGATSTPVDVWTIPTEAGLAYWSGRDGFLDADSPDEGPCVVLPFPNDAHFSPKVVASALKAAREQAPGLVAVVLGTDDRCDRLRRLLKSARLLSTRWDAAGAVSAGYWNAAVSGAAVVGLAARDLVDHPLAQAAWRLGVPVVQVRGREPDVIRRRILDAIYDRERREADIRIASALESRRLDADGVAAAWVLAHRRLLARKLDAVASQEDRDSRSDRAMAIPELRSRLTLTPLASREVLASWTLLPDDWLGALEWLGPEAVRAVLTIRLLDVTDVSFDGLNSHGATDVDLGPSETHRAIPLPFDGRSLAACLGVRSRWGYFHPIAHARICHLPREAVAPTPSLPTRRIRVMPARQFPPCNDGRC